MTGVARAATTAIFYYPWYSNALHDGYWDHWGQNGYRPPGDISARWYPAAGPYSSSDPALVDHQMSQIASAGIDEVVVSWWGRDSREDRRLPLVIAAARRHNIEVALHLEPYAGRSRASVEVDLAYAASLGIRDVFVYQPQDLPASEWAAARAEAPSGLRLFAATQHVGFAAAGGFDGVYSYDFVSVPGSKFARLCAEAHALGLLCAPSVGPGFDARRAGGSALVRSREKGLTYDRLWRAAVAAQPDFVTITSFNEWGEGTQIEPSRRQRGYASYDGAWGFEGLAAESAYLVRTAYWTNVYNAALETRSLRNRSSSNPQTRLSSSPKRFQRPPR